MGRVSFSIHPSRSLLNTNESYSPSIHGMGKWDILSLVFMSCCLVLASAAGIGGGPMFVPILAVFMNIPLKKALPLSSVIILGGSIANNFYGLLRRHPSADRPMIDFDISIVMVPMVIGGAVVGVFLSVMLPDFVIGILMVLVLGFYGFQATNKGLLARESYLRGQANTLEVAQTSSESGDLYEFEETAVAEAGDDQRGDDNSVKSSSKAGSVTEAVHPNKDSTKKFSYTHVPWSRIAFLFACVIGLIILGFSDRQLSCPSWEYWLVYWIELPWCASFSIAAAYYLSHMYKLKVEHGYDFIPGEVKFTKHGVLGLVLRMFNVGMMGGLFGIGGGVFAGPIMIQMNVLPEVAAATTAALVFFASMAAVVKYIAIGKIALNTFTLMLFALGFGITFVAQKFIMQYVRRSGKSYIIILMIGLSIVMGSVLMSYVAVALTSHYAHNGSTIVFCH